MPTYQDLCNALQSYIARGDKRLNTNNFTNKSHTDETVQLLTKMSKIALNWCNARNIIKLTSYEWGFPSGGGFHATLIDDGES